MLVHKIYAAKIEPFKVYSKLKKTDATIPI